MNAISNKNKIRLAGEVVTEPIKTQVKTYDGRITTFLEFKLKASRASGNADFVPVSIVYDPTDKIEVGDFLSLHGQLRSANKTENGKTRLNLFVAAFGYTVSKTPVEAENSIELEGYVTKAPTYRQTPSGREVSDVFIANNARYSTYYLPLIFWGKNARFAEDMQVGTRIELTGRLQSREYIKKLEDEKFERRTAYEVSGDSIAILEKPAKKETPAQQLKA